MIILPVLAAEQLQKIVLMKVCAVEKFGGRGGGRRPTVGTDLSTVIAGHSASEDALCPGMTGHGQWPLVLELTNLPETGIDEVRRDLPRRRTWSASAMRFSNRGG
jgi:hypothetical protein